MEETVKLDKWGYKVRTSSDACISAINAFYHQVLSYGRQRSVILEAPAHDKDCVLANILAALHLFSFDPSRTSSYLEAAKSHLDQATSYEKAMFDVISYLISEGRDNEVAVQLHSKFLKEFPRDLASVKRAQVLCFYMGQPDLSLPIVHQVLPHNEGENYIYGMLAFPLLELGRMREAEEAARKGFEINKEDIWAQHALCHVFQYKCQFKEAVQFMEGCSSSWSTSSSFMLTHNWWHVAICYLEGNAPRQRVLEVYDRQIWKELDRSDATKAEVYLNAVGLGLRFYVRDEIDIFGDRLKILAGCLTDQANWYLEWHLDVLIVWALTETDKISKAEELLKGLKYRLSKMPEKKQQIMQRGMLVWSNNQFMFNEFYDNHYDIIFSRIAMLAEAMYSYGRGNNKHGVELLGPDFDAVDYKIIGASDEQADVFNEVWYKMLLNTGEALKAIEVLEKQIKKREGIPFLWRLLEKGYRLANREEARIASEKARTLETAYFS